MYSFLQIMFRLLELTIIFRYSKSGFILFCYILICLDRSTKLFLYSMFV